MAVESLDNSVFFRERQTVSACVVDTYVVFFFVHKVIDVEVFFPFFPLGNNEC